MKIKKVLKIVGNILLWAFVAFAVAITALVFAAQNDSDGVPAIGGKCIINILTDSMSDTINPGDMIICEKLAVEEKMSLQAKDDEKGIEGDIITFKVDLDGDGTDELNTHRIVGINYDDDGNVVSYVTKGDHNPIDDTDPVDYRLVIAKYTGKRFVGLGNFLSFLQTSTGFLVCIVIPMVLFFGYELFRFIVTLMAVKNEGKKQITAADEEMIKQKAIEEYLRQQAEAAAKAQAAEKAEPENHEDQDAAAEETTTDTDNKTEN